MTKIKICGLSRVKDIEMVNTYKPDYCGFIINFPKSKRNISIQTLKNLSNLVSDSIKTVGVLVDQSVDTIKECALYVDMIQLHGREDNEFIQQLKKNIENPIIKAFIIQTKEDVEIANQSVADYILLDGGKGNGKEFNWDLLQYIKRDYFLAGGIGLDNINQALLYKPYALDLSSKVETDGFKDEKKIHQIIDVVRKGS